MGSFRTLDNIENLRGKRVLVRVDFNVPMSADNVADTTRIEHSVPTLRELQQRGGRVVLLSHMGRPKGRPDPSLSLKHIVPAARRYVGALGFADDCIGDSAARAVAALGDGDMVLLENVRFHAGEETNDKAFAKALAANGDLYVNDAFSVSHRAHASTEGVAHFLPAYAGRGMAAELSALQRALETPERPVVAFVGGAKTSTKIELLSNLVTKVETLVIGGAMANTFLAAQGMAVGASLHEPDLAAAAQAILARAADAGCAVILPVDVVVAPRLEPQAPTRTIPVGETGPADMILDIGMETLALLSRKLAAAKTVIWNGPLGAFEVPPFDTGTVATARQVALLTKAGRLISVAGGGDTAAALNHAGVLNDFTYVSTAGGAFLEWLEGKVLPGVRVLA